MASSRERSKFTGKFILNWRSSRKSWLISWEFLKCNFTFNEWNNHTCEKEWGDRYMGQCCFQKDHIYSKRIWSFDLFKFQRINLSFQITFCVLYDSSRNEFPFLFSLSFNVTAFVETAKRTLKSLCPLFVDE